MLRKFYMFQTDLGGGKELMITVGVTFLFGTRNHFFYYLAVLGLDKVIISYFKLSYHDPRPYIVAPWITPYKCSKGFGNPSGHSSAASLIAVTLFLDVFHGSKVGNSIVRFYSKWTYGTYLFLSVYWSASIPYSRFLMGVHSLDQIIFGATLGLWGGFFLHFLVRDNLLNHLELIMPSKSTEY